VPLIDRLDAVVFDVGNVLYSWDIRALYSKLIDDPARLDWFVGNVVTPEWHFQHDAGRDLADTSAELVALYPKERELIEAYGPRWLETIPGPVPGMIALVDELAARGTALYAITNFSHEFWPRFRETAPVFAHFRDVLVSGEERLVKPDPAIYALAIAWFGVNPARTLFVDDRADNVEAARAAGFQAVQFVDEPHLRTYLGLTRPSPKLTTHDFSDELAPHFRTINVEWIEAMYRLEPTDIEVLDNPRARVVDPGGAILFVEADGLGIVGTCALQKTGEQSFELTKMGVLEAARGLKAGEHLLRATIARAMEMGADPVYLLTNRKSEAAIHLYEKLGFRNDAEIMREYGSRYARCDVAMRYIP